MRAEACDANVCKSSRARRLHQSYDAVPAGDDGEGGLESSGQDDHQFAVDSDFVLRHGRSSRERDDGRLAGEHRLEDVGDYSGALGRSKNTDDGAR